MGKVADNVAAPFTIEDVRSLGDNIVTILDTAESMTRPDVFHAVHNALAICRDMGLEVEDDVSILTLLNELNTPRARKGTVLAVRFSKSIASLKGTPGTNR